MVFKIGKLELKSRVLLAPMLEPNDIAFRILCKRAGAGLTYTGMVSALSKRKMVLEDRPAVQLFGNSVKGIKSFIRKYDSDVSLWDFNLGCPSKLSKRLGHGGCLDDLKVIEDILKVMKRAVMSEAARRGEGGEGRGEVTCTPITIKLRKSERALEIARMACKYVDAIGIHARTVGQGYAGEVDYDFALELKKSVSVPVIFSGNVSKDNVDEILKDFDFVMVGRNAIGNPGIFSGKRVGFGEYLKLARKYGLFFRQVKFQAMNWTKGIAGARRLRGELVGARTIEDVEKIMK